MYHVYGDIVSGGNKGECNIIRMQGLSCHGKGVQISYNHRYVSVYVITHYLNWACSKIHYFPCSPQKWVVTTASLGKAHWHAIQLREFTEMCIVVSVTFCKYHFTKAVQGFHAL